MAWVGKSGKIKKGNLINDYPVYTVKSGVVGNEGLHIPDRYHGCKYNPMHFVYVFFVYNKDYHKFLL